MQARISLRFGLSSIFAALAALMPTDSGRAADAEEPASLSLKKLEAEAAALRDSGVAWRGIPWKTCLIDGLRASRERQKPIILWIFIDRPIDDERC